MTNKASSSDPYRKPTREAYKNVRNHSRDIVGVTLRKYQYDAADTIVNSVFKRLGLTIVIIFSRQSGKDEMLANVILYLLARFDKIGIDMVCAQPTFKPQTINAMERLKRRGVYHGRKLTRTAGYIFRHGQARAMYFSAEPEAQVVGATGRLIWMNEAQDILSSVYDAKFAPMGVAENATRVFSGTRWTEDTLLERELKSAQEAEKRDGIRRVFMFDADEVRKYNKWYGIYVDEEVKKLGRMHPLIQTQYFNTLLNSQSGMFNAARLALMQGNASDATETPHEGHLYAFLIDVAGQDEAMLNLDGMGNPGRDFTRLAIVDIDLSTLSALQKPTYHIVHRVGWQGLGHLALFGQLKAIGETWTPQYIVIDATGVGEGLWALMDKAFPTRVIPIKFTQQTKSEIGYGYLAIIETGRLRDCCPTDETRIQYSKCQSEILPGPAHTMRWGVKDGTRGPDGQLVHDDIVVSDALTAALDQLEWSMPFETVIISYPDPDKDAVKNF